METICTRELSISVPAVGHFDPDPTEDAVRFATGSNQRRETDSWKWCRRTNCERWQASSCLISTLQLHDTLGAVSGPAIRSAMRIRIGALVARAVRNPKLDSASMIELLSGGDVDLIQRNLLKAMLVQIRQGRRVHDVVLDLLGFAARLEDQGEGLLRPQCGGCRRARICRPCTTLSGRFFVGLLRIRFRRSVRLGTRIMGSVVVGIRRVITRHAVLTVCGIVARQAPVVHTGIYYARIIRTRVWKEWPSWVPKHKHAGVLVSMSIAVAVIVTPAVGTIANSGAIGRTSWCNSAWSEGNSKSRIHR